MPISSVITCRITTSKDCKIPLLCLFVCCNHRVPKATVNRYKYGAWPYCRKPLAPLTILVDIYILFLSNCQANSNPYGLIY